MLAMALDCYSRRRIPISSSQTLRRVFPELQIVSMLGSGAYGKVHLAIEPCGDKEYAIKFVTTNNFNFIQRRWLASEIRILQSLQHANIIRLLTVKEEAEGTIFVMEYARGGDLRTHLNRVGPMTDAEARRIMLQLCEALRYAHGKFVIHRDLKLDNVLLDEFENVKLADWGFAGEWKPGSVLTEAVGSLHYSAPEIVRAKPYMGPEVDCWSLGVILYALVTASLPFLPDATDPDQRRAERRMRERISQADFSIPPYVSTSCQALICGLLEPNSRKRLSIDDVLAHDWMSGTNFAPRSVTAAMLRRRASPPALLQSMINPRLQPSTPVTTAIASSSSSSTSSVSASPSSHKRKDSDKIAVPRPMVLLATNSRDGSSARQKKKPNSLRRVLTSLLTFEKSRDIPRCKAVEVETN